MAQRDLDDLCLRCKANSRLFREFCNGLPAGGYFIGACEVEKQKARHKWLKATGEGVQG